MERLSPVLYISQGGLAWMCPACDHPHILSTEQYGPKDAKARWTFNGNVNAPTFSPSILSTMAAPDGTHYVCHSFVRNGMIEYLSDCTHKFAGQIIPLGLMDDWINS